MSKHTTTTTKPTCQGCPRPITDHAYLCGNCGDKIAHYLGDIAALVEELTVTYTRQTSGDDFLTFSKSAETALPWSEAASAAFTQLQVVLGTWVHNLIGIHGGPTPGTDPIAMSRWLLNRVDWIRRHPNAIQALDRLRDVTSEINYVMEVRAERWYAGPCRTEYDHPETDEDDSPTWPASCLVQLYVKPGADTHACHGCGFVHDIPLRREWLLKQAEDHLAHAELIGRALASMGEAVTPSMIRNYADRGRIIAHGLDRKGRPTYRVGDVVEVIRQVEMERSRLEEKRAVKKAAKVRRDAERETLTA